ncbi:MAG: sulfatase-like hydrolase/transferase [Thermoanaerobaculia bacterium]|nr:sulfatase-like hydrolase/transferase [Thermoanaerobaculia bacterium]
MCAAIWLVVFVLQLSCSPSRPWNVVLVTFDTTRADHIGCYGSERARTPHLDALAAAGVRFDQAFAAAPITLPSHSTILTGLYPLAHGVRDNGLFRLAERQTTLAEILAAAGYRTAAAVGSFPLASRFGIDQGFEFYDDNFAVAFQDYRGGRATPKTGLYFDERPSSLVNDALKPWIEKHHDQPFFLWAHYFDPHQPYAPPPPFDQLFVDSPYDGEIAFADESFGRIMDQLRQLGVYDRTLIVMTADHGEGLGQHNELTHSTLAYNSTLHVPLILKIPGRTGGIVVDQRVGSVDITPTIVDLLGLGNQGEGMDRFQGHSLVPLINGSEASSPPIQYAETLAPRFSGGLGELRVLFARDHKYIHGPRPELFDLLNDPEETHDLVEEQRDLAATMERRLATFMKEHADHSPDAVADMDAETRSRLESLGYIRSQPGKIATPLEELRRDGVAPQDQVDDVNELSSAKQMLFEQRFLVALRLIDILLDRHPDNPYYLQLRASAEIGVGQVEEALATLERVRTLDPRALPTERVLVQVADYFVAKGEPARAIPIFEAQQEGAPSAAGRWILASLFAATGQPEKEIEQLQLALEQAPAFSPARVDLAVRRAQTGDIDTATREFERAIADMPYYPRAHFNFGAMLLDTGNTREALLHFRRAVAIEPRYIQARYAEIATASSLGQLELARTALSQLEAIAPDSSEFAAATALLTESP